VLAVALGPSVYLWNADTNSVQLLCALEQGDLVTSVSWMAGGKADFLAVGCNSSAVMIWDAAAQKLVRTLAGHNARVASLSWHPTQKSTLSSGGRDSLILHHDMRAAPGAAAAKLRGHRQEVCGLKWSPDGSTLASGGNENYLCVWDACMSGRRTGDTAPRVVLTEHTAAVKALAWAPFSRSLLASGGGTADRTIKFWNASSGALLDSVDTGSQVCSLLWSPHKKELVSSHGFSQNQLVLWAYPTLAKLKEFRGHTARVLHLDASPDGSTVVSAAADETLRFWSIFGAPRKPVGQAAQFLGRSSGLNMSTIR
jgi:cell division cycle protein 20 (cofactor of APC complex)